jgi:hypothetical protein
MECKSDNEYRQPYLKCWSRTETGCLSVFVPKSTNVDNWPYFKFSDHFKAHIIPHDQDDEGEVGELVVLVCTISSNLLAIKSLSI